MGLSDYPPSSLPLDILYHTVFCCCDGGIDKLACVGFRSLGMV